MHDANQSFQTDAELAGRLRALRSQSGLGGAPDDDPDEEGCQGPEEDGESQSPQSAKATQGTKARWAYPEAASQTEPTGCQVEVSGRVDDFHSEDLQDATPTLSA